MVAASNIAKPEPKELTPHPCERGMLGSGLIPKIKLAKQCDVAGVEFTDAIRVEGWGATMTNKKVSKISCLTS